MAQQVVNVTKPGSVEGCLDLNEWLTQWNLSQYTEQLRKQGIESPSDFKYIKSKEQFDRIIAKLGDDMPIMHVLKLQDAWTTIVPETQQKPDSKVVIMIGPKEMEIRKKLHDRFKDVSEDIHVLQTAINKFNESIVAAKKSVNDNTEQIIVEANNKRERLLNEIDSIQQKNKQILNDKLHHLQRISKISKYNQQQFDVRVAETSSDADQLKELLTLNTEDDEKQKKNNYDHFKEIGKECCIPGSVNIVFDEQSMKNTIDSILSVQNDTITHPWNLKQYYHNQRIKLKFDTSWSTEYYTFSQDGKVATKKVSGYAAARLLPAITNDNYNTLSVKFRVGAYSYYGVGNGTLEAKGFPGYTANGWMFRSTNGGDYHRSSCDKDKKLQPQPPDCLNKEVEMSFDLSTKKLTSVMDGKTHVSGALDVDVNDELFFVFAMDGVNKIEIF